MNGRQRVRAAIAYHPPDRLPANDSFWDGTLDAWRQQDMPGGVTPADYFDFDIAFMYLDTSYRLEMKILGRDGPYIIYQDRYGCTIKKLDGLSGTQGFLRHITEDRTAWDRLRSRLTLSTDSNQPARLDTSSYFTHFGPYPRWDEARIKYERLYATGRYVLFAAYWPWAGTWRHRGFQEGLLDVGIAPERLKEMGEAYQGLVIAILSKCLQLGITPDGYLMVDDLAGSQTMFMSPASWRSIYKPAVGRLGDFLRCNGIDFWMLSDGNIKLVLAELVECGVRTLNPLEVSAGLDWLELRKKYAGRLAFYGNISVKRMLGPEEEIKAELHAKIPPDREGGYIYHSDHSVPPQVSFERYQWLLREARQLFQQQGGGRPGRPEVLCLPCVGRRGNYS